MNDKQDDTDTCTHSCSTHAHAETMVYRLRELARLNGIYSEYSPKIKIIKACGETNWLDVTEDEIRQIADILIKK